MLEIIKDYQSPSLAERETIITYDDETKRLHLFADTPKHARKFEKFLDESLPCRKGYSPTGILLMLDGYMIEDTYFTIQKKRVMSEEQRALAAERARKTLHAYKANNG